MTCCFVFNMQTHENLVMEYFPLMVWQVHAMLLFPRLWPILLTDAVGECRHVLTISLIPATQNFISSQSLSNGRVVRKSLVLSMKGDDEQDEGKSFHMCTSRTLPLTNNFRRRDNWEWVSLRRAWDHWRFPSRQRHLYPLQGEWLTDPFFHHTNRTHLLLESKTHQIRREHNSQGHCYKSGPGCSKAD